MIVVAEVNIKAPRPAVWAAITDIEHAAATVSGIESIEILDKPANGLVGLKWRETRILFGKPATVDKWITEAVDNESYTSKAESDGFIFLTTKRIAEGAGGVTLSETHVSDPQGLKSTLMAIPMRLFFKGVVKKAVLQDLNDFKAALEQGATVAA